MRKCPKCSDSLVQTWLYRQEVDRCGDCHGTFYDHGELAGILDIVKAYQSIRLDEKEIETLPPSKRKEYLCPVDSEPMERKDYGGLPVDVCRECRGVWLDDGELLSLKRTEDHIRRYMALYVRMSE